VEPVLEKLIEWAETALETSSNQPILPVAILAINAFEDAVDSAAWDPEYSTTALLESLAATVDQNLAFAKYAELWRSRGRVIQSVEQLFLCYFSSFKVSDNPIGIPPQRRCRWPADIICRSFIYHKMHCRDACTTKSRSYTPKYTKEVKQLESINSHYVCFSILMSYSLICKMLSSTSVEL
jgi:hypothetical protein